MRKHKSVCSFDGLQHLEVDVTELRESGGNFMLEAVDLNRERREQEDSISFKEILSRREAIFRFRLHDGGLPSSEHLGILFGLHLLAGLANSRQIVMSRQILGREQLRVEMNLSLRAEYEAGARIRVCDRFVMNLEARSARADHHRLDVLH